MPESKCSRIKAWLMLIAHRNLHDSCCISLTVKKMMTTLRKLERISPVQDDPSVLMLLSLLGFHRRVGKKGKKFQSPQELFPQGYNVTADELDNDIKVKDRR